MTAAQQLPVERPGKIVAVHLSYASRAAQRGRTPAHPSYFFKPASSLASSGGTVERPAGTELLAFEGEVALVIGTAARNIEPADAWLHVAAVTAANDLGVYELRAPDKGSNVRSKGRDGYTPLGPALIQAADVDPDALRVRTWVNGTLVQDDSTAKLLFPLAEIIADLSQHMTLEPGDLILTGTPAGSSVINPGDVVEVEVDAPTCPGAPTSGRLITTVTQGSIGFADYGDKPATDDIQRAEAWGSREAAGLAPDPATQVPDAAALATAQPATLAQPPTTQPGASGDTTPVLTDELRTMLNSVAVATISAQLRKRGFNEVSVDRVHPLAPGTRVVGQARTLRFVPYRPDLFKTHGGGYNAQKRAFDSLGPGDVLVVEARGLDTTGTVGDILALRAKVLGAAGVVTDGGVRDARAVADLGLPTFAQGVHPAVLGRRHIPWETDVTVACGGACVQPGDVIVGDDDGVVVIPPTLVAEVAYGSVEQECEESFIAERVAEGHPVDGLYPMNAEWKARYAAWRANR